MKRCFRFLLFLALLLHCLTSYSQQSWQATNNFIDTRIFIQSPDTIYTAGQGGGIAKSVDGGATWFYPNNDKATFFAHAVFMVNNTDGFYYTYQFDCYNTCLMSNVYKTDNAGCDWTKMATPVTGSEYITGLVFISPTTGWVSTNSGKIFKTTDGSQTWSLFYNAGFPLLTLAAFDAQHIAAGGISGIVSTKNGGASWAPNVVAPGWGSNKIEYVNSNTLFSSGRYIYKSTDGGTTWQTSLLLPGVENFLDVTFRDANYGLAIQNDSKIFKTTDGGNTWAPQRDQGTWPLSYTDINGPTEMVIGNGTILKYQPGPNYSWKVIANGISGLFATTLKYSHDGTVAYIDAKLSGNLHRSDDYGKNWRKISVGETGYSAFYDVSMDASGNAIGVGRSGRIYNTLNEGKDWFQQLNTTPPALQQKDLVTVQLNNSGNAWAAGQQGVLLHSSDKGNNWKQQTLPISTNIYSLSFTDDNNGWLSADNNVAQTTNGGTSWQVLLTQANRSFVQTKFTSTTNGWLLSNATNGLDTSFVLQTTDGGSSWNRKLAITYPYSYFTFAPLVGIDIPVQNIIRAYTRDSIYYSQNGGQSWQSSFFGHPITKIKFHDANNGFIVSSLQIYYTKNGGQTWSVYSPLDYVDFYAIDTKPGKVIAGGSGNAILYNKANLATDDDWQYQLQPREFSDGNGAFDFLDSSNGWKFHQVNRVIAHTSNGGRSWKTLSTISVSVDTTLFDLYFSSLNTGYATDNHGNFLKTTDKGKTWTYKKIGDEYETLNCISFINDNYGFFGGAHGLFVSTSSGGATYTTGHLPSQEGIEKVICTSPGTAWIKTSNKIYLTTNGGTSWINKPLPVAAPVYDIAFINDTTGWVLSYPAGGPVIAYYTHNSGASWEASIVSPYNIQVRSIAFNKLKQGIAYTYGTTVGNGALFVLPSQLDSLKASFITDTLDFCKRQLRLTATANLPQADFNWIINGVTYTGSPLDITLPASQDTARIMLAASSAGTQLCNRTLILTDTTNNTVIFDKIPVAKFFYDSACNNSQFAFKNLSLPVNAGSQFLWNFNDGITSTLFEPQHHFAAAGDYKVKLLAYSLHQCPSDTFTLNVHANAFTVAPLQKSNDLDCSAGTSQLTAPSGFTSYEWSPRNSVTQPFSNVTMVNPAATQLYYVVMSGNGCTIKDSIEVIVKGTATDKIFLPNTFTPNKDGRNDCFGVRGGGVYTEFKLLVYNRWGEMVYSTDKAGGCWDGIYKGAPQEQGNYVYYLKAKSSCGNVALKGNLLLLR